jgi:hypothetical protein
MLSGQNSLRGLSQRTGNPASLVDAARYLTDGKARGSSTTLIKSPHVATYVSKIILQATFSGTRRIGILQDVLAKYWPV